MTDLIDDYLAELGERLAGDPLQRERVANESRDLLRVDALAIERAHPRIARLDAQRAAIARFGNAAELARGPASPTPARAARDAERATRLAIALLSLLVLGVGVTAWALGNA